MTFDSRPSRGGICRKHFFMAFRSPSGFSTAPQAAGAPAAECNSAAGGAKILGTMIYNLQCFFKPQPPNSTFDLRRRPRAGGAAPAPLVLLRGSGSPAVCLRKGGEPSPSHSQRANPRLVSPPAPQAFGFRVPAPRAAPCLVPPSASPGGLAPVLREPARSARGSALVSLRSFASPSGSASLRRWSCFASFGALRALH